MGHAPILAHPDAVLGVSHRALFYAAGSIESAIALYLLTGTDDILKCALVTWLALLFIAYRLGIYLLNPAQSCPCLGTVTEALPFNPNTLDVVLKLIVIYLLSGGIYFFVKKWNSQPHFKCRMQML